jgi:ABC-type nitrate/sulfonate/bicarbonate transport system substrate-binding protein
MKKRRLLKGAIFALAATAVPLTASAMDTVKVAYMKIPPLVHMIHAKETGIFEKNGVKVDLIVVNGGPELMTALASGSVDIGMTAVGIVLAARAKGLKLKAFGTSDVEREGYLHNWIVTKEEAGVGSLKDLEGKVVGIVAKGSPAELTVRAHMLSAGADPNKVRFVALPFPQLPSALEVGNVDAIHTGEPFYSQAMHSDKMHAKTIAEALLPDTKDTTALGGWFAQDGWLADEKNREVAGRFLKSVLQANQELMENRELINNILVRDFGMPAEVAAHVPIPLTTDTLVADPKTYQSTVDMLAKTGMIKEAYPAEDAVEVVTYE